METHTYSEKFKKMNFDMIWDLLKTTSTVSYLNGSFDPPQNVLSF